MFKILIFLFLILQIAFAEDHPKKIFYIDANIELDQNTTWEDVGVLNADMFTGAINKSWKTWGENHFKTFDLVEMGNEPAGISNLHRESYTLKWSSIIKKLARNKFEISAQYVLQASKYDNILLSFIFPNQIIMVNPENKKETSSKLASAIYNLLNSQTNKISSIRNASDLAIDTAEFSAMVTGQFSLSDLLVVNSILQERFKDIGLTSELRTFKINEGQIYLKAKTVDEKLIQALVQAGKMPLNEQKILIFNPENKSFAILLKEQNNEKVAVPVVETPTTH